MNKCSSISAVLVVLLGTPALAQEFSYSDFATPTGLTLNGNAGFAGKTLRLNKLARSQAGSAWHTTPVQVTAGFETTFAFRIGEEDSTGGDGLAFVIHNDPDGATALGDWAVAMGYGAFANAPSSHAVGNSLVLELDTFLNATWGDPDGNHLSLHTMGSADNTPDEVASIGLASPVADFSNGRPHIVRLRYQPGQLDLYLDDLSTPILSVPYEIVNGSTGTSGETTEGLDLLEGTAAYVGFTAGTGTAFENHDILWWKWNSRGDRSLATGEARGELEFVGDEQDADVLVSVELEGFVLGPDGAPAEGAVVVSSAGGQASTDVAGYFQLEVAVPSATECLQLTAVGRRGKNLVASSSVLLGGASTRVRVSPLLLSSGTSCASTWLPTFGSQQGVNATVGALAVFDDGSGPALYAGGAFTTAGSAAANFIARWNGTNWSALGSGMNNWVYALKEFNDGSGLALYVGGIFTAAGGVAANGIAKWNGTSWSALGSGMSGGAPTVVYALSVFDDGSGPALYVGGVFHAAGGVPANGIARWNGTSWSALGSGINGGVHAMSEFDDGGGPALYVGGGFSSAGGLVTNHIARWNGSNWSALGSGMNGMVFALSVFDEGSGPALYAGGVFSRANGLSTSNVAKWDGTSWSALGSGVRNAFGSSVVYALSAFDDGSGPALYAGGDFTIAGGISANRIARWNGVSWAALESGIDGPVVSLSDFDDGGGPALYAGGTFTSAGGLASNGIAKWDCPDSTAPTLSCPSAVSVMDRKNSAPGEVVSFTVTASDDLDPAPTVVCVPPSGSLFPRGTTIITCTATDASGNQSTCQFPVHVLLHSKHR